MTLCLAMTTPKLICYIIAMNSALNYKTKSEYRIYAKKLRTELDIKKISVLISKRVIAQNFYKKSKNILGFYPFNSEISLIELFKDDSKNWFLPSIDEVSKEIFIHPYKYGDKLVKNKFNVPEPVTEKENDLKKIDLVFVPALMVDKKGYRLGYGAGYYDRFLPLLKDTCVKIVPITEELFVESLPYDDFDVPVDIVVTEKMFNSIF
jgi:5-formyltetrahydrofolate cyclo-ligase